MKALIMNTSGKFTKEEMGSYSMEKNTAALHWFVNDKFILPKEVRQSPFPVKSLHQLVTNNSLFTFSFVRHPHSRLLFIKGCRSVLNTSILPFTKSIISIISLIWYFTDWSLLTKTKY